MDVYQKRSILLYVILSIFTCGIFTMYWVYTVSNELYEFNDEMGSPGLDVVLSIITCGIYLIYLNYKWGKKLYAAQEKRKIPASDNSILFLILSFFGLCIINLCIIQSNLNNNFYPDANNNGNGNNSQF